MIKAIVIGAGVMGASVAYRLAQAGAAVTVLEATRIGGGTSGISFAWTNAHKKPPKPYHDLNVASMKAHAALADEFGATPWWYGGGSLEWEAEPDRTAQRENIQQLRSWGYAASGSRRARCANWSPTLIQRRSAMSRWRFSRKRVGSIRWSTPRRSEFLSPRARGSPQQLLGV